MTEAPLIQVQDLVIERQGRRLLEKINTKIYPGKIITLLGPNGAGKSTFVKALIGLIKPTKGRVILAKGLRIGYMPQRLSLNITLPITVERFLSLLAPGGKQEVQEILKLVNASKIADRSLHVLSGGEMQRILLARALLGRPNLLVLDEPLSGMDVAGQQETYQLILEIRRKWGCAVLLVSHDLHVVFAASDQVICLHGHICCEGHPESVRAMPEYEKLFGQKALQHLALYKHEHDHKHVGHDIVPESPKET